MGKLAKPGQSSEPSAIRPFWILSRTTPGDCAYTSGSAADKAQVEQRLLANLYCTWCYSLIESRI